METNCREFLTFDSLTAEIRTNNLLRKLAWTYEQGIEDLLHEYGVPDHKELDQFFGEDAASPKLIDLPSPADMKDLGQYSRITLLTREDPKFVGGYLRHTAIVLTVSNDEAEGFIYMSDKPIEVGRRIAVTKDQIIDCYPPLQPGQSDELIARKLLGDDYVDQFIQRRA